MLILGKARCPECFQMQSTTDIDCLRCVFANLHRKQRAASFRHTHEGHRVTRPSFKIDPEVLRSLRKELDLTQLELAKSVHKILGIKTTDKTNDSSLISIYQRIEKTGNTSRKRAVALANILKTTVEILQGGRPEDSSDFVGRIEQQILEQKESGNNATLELALGQHIKTYTGQIDEGDCMRDFAEDIGVQIEVAQIGQNPIEIARLAELTGWSEVQLQQSGSVHGHWLLLTTVFGSRETEIVLGASRGSAGIRTEPDNF